MKLLYQVKKNRVENYFINYFKEFNIVKANNSVFYAHSYRYVLFVLHSERFIKIYYTNLLYTFSGEIPHNYKELIEKQLNLKGYEIIMSSLEKL